ncbi:MAG: hypothetical protein LBQ61_00580 [Spirochaetales bacterium]|jgi:biotin carboxyl carrier protein|nr:hypothetical protein [Spirochaetales bacterium]
MERNITFEFQGFVYDVKAERKGDILTLTHRGASYPVNLNPGKPRTVANDYLTAVPQGGGASAGSPAVQAPAVQGPAVSVQAPASSPASGGPAVQPPASGGASEKAPLTGTIREVRVSPGQQVSQGQVIILMEAMKMDIEVFASLSGTVAAVLVRPGDSVADKQPLVTWA